MRELLKWIVAKAEMDELTRLRSRMSTVHRWCAEFEDVSEAIEWIRGEMGMMRIEDFREGLRRKEAIRRGPLLLVLDMIEDDAKARLKNAILKERPIGVARKDIQAGEMIEVRVSPGGALVSDAIDFYVARDVTSAIADDAAHGTGGSAADKTPLVYPEAKTDPAKHVIREQG